MSEKESQYEKIKSLMLRIEEIEREAKAERKLIKLQLGELVLKLARSVETRAERATVIRALYWDFGVPVDLIEQAFHVVGKTWIIAGSFTSECKCPNFSECQGIIRREFTSRTDKTNFEISLRKSQHRYSSVVCQTCQENWSAEAEAERIEREAKEKRIEEWLLSLSWPAFTNTERWQELLHDFCQYNSIRCVVCKESEEDLNLCFEKSVKQYPMNFSEIMNWPVLLCDGCFSRNSDLMNPDWLLRYQPHQLYEARFNKDYY